MDNTTDNNKYVKDYTSNHMIQYDSSAYGFSNYGNQHNQNDSHYMSHLETNVTNQSLYGEADPDYSEDEAANTLNYVRISHIMLSRKLDYSVTIDFIEEKSGNYCTQSDPDFLVPTKTSELLAPALHEFVAVWLPFRTMVQHAYDQEQAAILLD